MSVPDLLVRDVTRAGRELGRATVRDVPARCSLRELLARRIHAEVAAYNDEPGPVFAGLVQPEDAIRYSDGFRLREPRRLDADRLLEAAEEAVTAGMLAFRVRGEVVTDLDVIVDLRDVDEVLAVLERPVVAARS